MIRFLSPSALKKVEQQPMTFLMSRLASPKMATQGGNLGAAFGSAVDVLTKIHLLKEKMLKSGLTPKDLYLRLINSIYSEKQREEYLKDNLETVFYKMSVEEQYRKVVLSPAIAVRNAYVSSPLVKDLTWHSVEEHIYWTLPNGVSATHGGNNNGTPAISVPLFMKLDASVYANDGEIVPLDLKVNGYGSESGASPKPGYRRIWSPEDGMSGPHKDHNANAKLASIDDDWALQMCTYGWAIGRPIGVPFSAVIHQFVFRPTGYRIAEYVATIDAEYQQSLLNRYRSVWLKLRDSTFVRQQLGYVSDCCSDKRFINSYAFYEWLASCESWY